MKRCCPQSRMLSQLEDTILLRSSPTSDSYTLSVLRCTLLLLFFSAYFRTSNESDNKGQLFSHIYLEFIYFPLSVVLKALGLNKENLSFLHCLVSRTKGVPFPVYLSNHNIAGSTIKF